jgi:16S rRNA processing protein RimM
VTHTRSPQPIGAPASLNSPKAQSDWVRIAHLVRTQGRHGELLAEILTDFPEAFATRTAVFLASPQPGSTPQPVTVERHWLHKGRLVLKFAGVDSISAAEALRGLDVVIPREQRVPLHDGSLYIDDLIGCAVLDAAQPGAPVLGTIRAVVPQPETADLLVVTTAAGGEILIPFAKAYLVQVDTAAQRVTLRLPAGLLEINAPPTTEERAGLGEV